MNNCRYEWGNEIRPSFSVYWKGKELVLNSDYKLTYSNNRDSYEVTKQDACVNIEGIGNYNGNIKEYFRITPRPTGKKENSGEYISDTYILTEKNIKPKFYDNYYQSFWVYQLIQEKDYSYYEKSKRFTLEKGYGNEEDKNCFSIVCYLNYEFIAYGNYTGAFTRTSKEYFPIIDTNNMLRIYARYGGGDVNYRYLNELLNGALDKYIVDINKVTVTKNKNTISLVYTNPVDKKKYTLEEDRHYTIQQKGNSIIIKGKNAFKGQRTVSL